MRNAARLLSSTEDACSSHIFMRASQTILLAGLFGLLGCRPSHSGMDGLGDAAGGCAHDGGSDAFSSDDG